MYFSDFVDALSSPIQFLSQAEKRAKQLEGLGIDEKDISEVLVSVRQKREPLAAAADIAQSSTSCTTSTTTTFSSATQQTGSDKETKGAAS